MSEQNPIKLMIENKVAHIVLDRPPDNRMNNNFFQCLKQIIDELKKRKDVGVVVMYSASRHFSAGADVDDIKMNIKEPFANGVEVDVIVKGFITKQAWILVELESLEVPVICAVSGFCTGSGLELALACSIRFCSTDAIVGCPELSWGIITGLSGSIRLEKIVGKEKAKEIILRGDMLSAQEAFEIGIMNRIMKRKELLPNALKFANIIANSDQTCVKTLKKTIFQHKMNLN